MFLPEFSRDITNIVFSRSFADFPHIIRDHFRGFVRRGVGMQAPLVFRPFAPDNNTLIWRDRGLLSSRAISTFDATHDNEISLSDRLKGRESRIPGLVNTGNFCFMNSVLQVFYPFQLRLM
jgi:hypothetical protein